MCVIVFTRVRWYYSVHVPGRFSSSTVILTFNGSFCLMETGVPVSTEQLVLFLVVRKDIRKGCEELGQVSANDLGERWILLHRFAGEARRRA